MGQGSRSGDGAIRAFVVPACFFVTGGAGLIYELVWNRTLVLLMGNTAYALATLLTLFMGGLALGARIGSRLAPSGWRAIRFYGCIEVLLAAYCLILPFLLRLAEPVFGWLYVQLNASLVALSLAQFVLIGCFLLVPTALMGATLPVLTRFRVKALSRVSGEVGWLYGINAMGACAGALLAGFVLLPRLGVQASYHIAIGLNLVVGLSCFILTRNTGRDTSEVEREEPTATPAMHHAQAADDRLLSSPSSARGWMSGMMIAFGCSGAASMLYQVAWTRSVSLSFGSYDYAFTLIAAAFILGIALGSLALGRVGDSRHGSAALAALPLVAAAGALLTVPALGSLPVRTMNGILGAEGFGSLGRGYFMEVFVMFLVPTFCMGGMLPIIARRLTSGVEEAGRAVGSAYAANTVGTIVGAFAAGFVLIPAIGMRATILLGVALSAAVGVFFLQSAMAPRPAGVRALGSTFVLTVFGCLIAVAPGWEREIMTSGPYVNATLYQGLADKDDAIRDKMRGRYEIVFYREDAAGVVTVGKDAQGFLNLSVGGKLEARSRSPVQSWLGHLPLLLRPDAERALVLGLGSGGTLAAVARHPVREIDCVEISQGVVEAARAHFHAINDRVLEDERVDVVIGDGRLHLEYGEGGYDVIVSQPANPWLAGAAAMFTRECFEAMKAGLAPAGVACVWFQGYAMPLANFRSVAATWAGVWEHPSIWRATSHGDWLFVGSDTPLQIDMARLLARLREPALAKDFRDNLIPTPAHAVSLLVTVDQGVRQLAMGATVNTDDNGRIAFDTPLSMWRDESFEIFEAAHQVRVDPWTQVAADAGNAEHENLRLVAADLLRSQHDLHRALHLSGPGAETERLVIVEDVLRRNQGDGTAMTLYVRWRRR